MSQAAEAADPTHAGGSPQRAHSIVARMEADTAKDLVWELRYMADRLERGELSVGYSGSPSGSSIYSYRVAPEQTHDAYFRQVDEWLKARPGLTSHPLLTEKP